MTNVTFRPLGCLTVRARAWLILVPACCVLALCPGAAARAADPVGDARAVPHLSERGRASYLQFLAAEPHRAFAIAPGGGWAWRAGLDSGEAALAAALAACRQHTEQRCVPYAVDNRVVFDAAAWRTLWRPYATAAAAKRLPEGTRRGERFPDLAWRTPGGAAGRLADLRGKVVVLHFWGSWCPPCLREMPELAKLHAALEDVPDIRFVLVPVREPFQRAKDWAARKGIRLPLYDPGLRSEDDAELPLAGGGRLPDRQVARMFPTTYVLDRHGVVLFSHVGETLRWPEYAPFLEDAAAHSGRRGTGPTSPAPPPAPRPPPLPSR